MLPECRLNDVRAAIVCCPFGFLRSAGTQSSKLGVCRFPVWRGCSNVAVRHNPLVTVDVHNVISGQVLHVHENQCRPTDKDEDVTDKGKVGILKLMGHHLFQFFLRQELTFLAVRADMVTDFVACKARTAQTGSCWGKRPKGRATGNLAVVVCSQNNTFQPHAPLPNSAISQSSVCAEIGGKVLDKLWCQFFDERGD